jgi:hypothetical protein
VSCRNEKVEGLQSPFVDRISFYSNGILNDGPEYTECNILPLYNQTSSFILITSDTCLIKYHRNGKVFLEEEAWISNAPMPNFIIAPNDSVLLWLVPVLSHNYTQTAFSKEMGNVRKEITRADSIQFVIFSANDTLLFTHDSVSYYNCLWPPSYDCIEKWKLDELYRQ